MTTYFEASKTDLYFSCKKGRFLFKLLFLKQYVFTLKYMTVLLFVPKQIFVLHNSNEKYSVAKVHCIKKDLMMKHKWIFELISKNKNTKKKKGTPGKAELISLFSFVVF